MENFFNKLVEFFEAQHIDRGLAIAYIIVSALLGVMIVVALIMRLIVVIRYFKSNRQTSSTGMTSGQIARFVLDKNGLTDIQVQKSGFFRAWIFGNSYSPRTKTIYLRRTIWEKNSLTAIGIALQKVGVAKMCETGGKSVKVRYAFQVIGLFGPILLLPSIIIGFIIDIVVFHAIGVFTLAGIGLGLAIVVGGFIVTLLNITIEKKANAMALEMIDEAHYASEEERATIKKLFDTYLIAYICEFIVTILRILQIVLEIVMRAQSGKK